MALEDVGVELDGHVGIVEIRRPPNNFMDVALLGNIATALEDLDRDPQCRAVVLAAQGKHFCAGGDLKARLDVEARGEKFVPARRHPYKEARRLMGTRKPIVAAVQGAAIGAGLGLAAFTDFRVTCKEARFAANFTAIGFHPGFGLTVLLPRLVGHQKARWLMLTGQRITGEEAHAIGLADRLVAQDQVRSEAIAMAHELSRAAPLSVQATRETLNLELVAAFRAATERESFEQNWLRETRDYKEGVEASTARREPNFTGS
jgi:enoyl-CoA hydratase/carnithine racemase